MSVDWLINLKPLRDPVGSQIKLDELRIFLSSSKGKCSRSSPLIGDDLHSALISELEEQVRASTSSHWRLVQSNYGVHILPSTFKMWTSFWAPKGRFRGSNESWPQCWLCLCKSLKLPVPQFPYWEMGIWVSYWVKCWAQHQAQRRCSLMDAYYYKGDSDEPRQGLTKCDTPGLL